MDIGLILATTIQEPGLFSRIGVAILAGLGVAAGLTFVIFVHELGHFLIAKACGVKCEKFYVGFDFFEFRIPFTNWKIPRALVKVQWGETEYGIGSLPLGGYVKMLGQDDDPRNAEHEANRIRQAGGSDAARAESIASAAAAEGLLSGQKIEKGANEALAAVQAAHGDPAHEPPVPAKTTEGKTILLDPRSYPAKPVPARMAIISAGVIMNVIFAVILAAVAYRLGVEEMPAIVGGTSPGGAAWLEGMQPGAKIVQIGKSGQPHEFLRWAEIKTAAVLNSGHDVSMRVRQPNGQDVWYDLRPTQKPDAKLPMIGIAPPHNARIEMFPAAFAHLNPAASPPLEDFDRVVEAAGQKVTSGSDLSAIFAQQPLGPITLKVERGERAKDGKPVEKSTRPPEVIETTVQPRPMRDLGLAMKMGPITAVRKGSPAADAGFLANDLVVDIDGQPVGNPLSLSQRLTPQPGESRSFVFTVERKNSRGQLARKSLTVTPEPPLQSPTEMPTNPTSIEPIGIAFEVTSEVAQVDPEGPAAAAGLLPGDVIQALEFEWKDPRQAKKLSHAAHAGDLLLEKIELASGKSSWAGALFLVQMTFPGTKVKLTWKRAGKAELMSGVLEPHDSATFFNDTRGIAQYLDFQPHQAANWSEAFALGFREAGDQLTQVLTILHRLITARLSATNLSGPLGIISFAGSVASQGVAALLLFLTMLSANLAVLNFLPIPALDGGHMLFLSAEAVRGKPVDERLQVRLTIAGVICLLSLMVFATAMDIHRFAEMIQRWFG